jgi:hypothetical protein
MTGSRQPARSRSQCHRQKVTELRRSPRTRVPPIVVSRPPRGSPNAGRRRTPPPCRALSALLAPPQHRRHRQATQLRAVSPVQGRPSRSTRGRSRVLSAAAGGRKPKAVLLLNQRLFSSKLMLTTQRFTATAAQERSSKDCTCEPAPIMLVAFGQRTPALCVLL